MKQPQIVVVNFGAQYGSLIVRSLRELGYRSALLPPEQVEKWVEINHTKAIILSGGPASVYNPGAPTISKKVMLSGIPILGICYGMQLIAHKLGGIVKNLPGESEYGDARITVEPCRLFHGLPERTKVWASHGDTVTELPPNFTAISFSDPRRCIAGFADKDEKIWGLQFHPEVNDTPLGSKILENFAQIAGLEKDWLPGDLVSEIKYSLLEQTGHAMSLIGFSGGVDSTTLATIARLVLGNKLKAVCVDGGQLREGELSEVRANAEYANVALEIVSAKLRFLSLWPFSNPEYDPELKRKLFREQYQNELARIAQQKGLEFFIQGTLAPDMIESGKTGGDCIKTHHNTGVVLPGCKSLHPLSHLFKYEVRELAREIGLPDVVVNRQPFPGPGLFVRTVGGWPTAERLDIVRWADNETAKILKEHGIYGEISQLVVALPCIKVVGVKGDGRVYDYPIWVRAVKTQDFMTAKGVQFPDEVEREINSSLTKHPHIVSVLYDSVDKPPRTVEFE